MSELMTAVKARVAEGRANHAPGSDATADGCCGQEWPCDAARYLSFAEARLARIERVMAFDIRKENATLADCVRFEDAESELREMARLLGVQG